MSASPWVKVPIGPDGPRWSTVHPQRTALVVVHTLTAWNRLADILPVFDSDHRVQLVFTFPGASAIDSDVEHTLHTRGAIRIDWSQAVRTEFDLAISVHNSGDLHDINAPLITLSHGMGYTKHANHRITESPNHRITESPNHRITESPNHRIASVYGLSPEWLVRDGSVVPAAIVLSHHEQFERLAATTPQALPSAVVAGDPCFDRLRASLPERSEYRRALGAGTDSTVVAVSSTWGDKSLLGRHPELIGELLAELPDDHVVAAILHPNTWYAHGPWQLRYWLGRPLRAGLRLIPPAVGWQQTIIAADVTVGDHGAVTGYSAALRKPTLLASFPEEDVAAGSAVAAVGSAAPRLDVRRGLVDQLHDAIRQHSTDRFDEAEQLTSSVPDDSAQHLRRLCYRLMDLPEPTDSALVPVYPARELVPERETVRAWWIDGEWHADGVRLTRWPADVSLRRGRNPVSPDRFLVVASTHPQRDMRNSAAVVVREVEAIDEADDVLDRLLASFPACRLAVAATGDQCWMRERGGRRFIATTADSVATAAAVHLWSQTRQDRAPIPSRFELSVGTHCSEVVVTEDQ